MHADFIGAGWAFPIRPNANSNERIFSFTFYRPGSRSHCLPSGWFRCLALTSTS